MRLTGTALRPTILIGGVRLDALVSGGLVTIDEVEVVRYVARGEPEAP